MKIEIFQKIQINTQATCVKAAWGSIIYGQQMCASEMMRYQAKPAMSSILSDDLELGLEGGGFCRMVLVAKTSQRGRITFYDLILLYCC